ncbi:uncharacterized protein LOC105837590 isoform X5 [Monomorium pharaonis]|uniref:uncharacterized protein LOC105837590 isoform X5 n=1 Tax=Monomorium pharaonis TaxID=307658 RepID=UPI001747D588|nr:uncharacterized protein LOC105837590 isoform X5 [Monomorium pharaonis]
MEMWYQIFLWALFSSIFVHTIAGAICFATLRQHKYGKSRCYRRITAVYQDRLALAVGSPPSTRIVPVRRISPGSLGFRSTGFHARTSQDSKKL